MSSATIKIFLPSGEPTQLRTAEISNWSGKALAAPRTELDHLLRRPELDSAGIYMLIGFDPETNDPMAYIGEAEIVKDRLPAHRQLEFWIQAVVFVSKDENLTKAHIRYLEGRLIEQSLEIGRVKLHNSQASGARLPESDQADAEVFLEKIHQLLPVLGSDILTPISPQDQQLKDEGEYDGEAPLLILTIKGLVAKGKRTSTGFVVLKDSQAVIKDRGSLAKQNPAYATLRQKLKQEATLVQENSYMRFVRDTEFKSPSAAAVAVRGGSANGLTAWKNSKGRTLKQIEESGPEQESPV